MKRLVAVGFSIMLYTVASAQLGNEWINFAAPYYKIPVGKDGIYRLTRAQLLAAGVPSFIDPKSIKIYHRGVEQSIYVDGENDSQLNTNDFVEFYGRKNDGTLDQRLYSSSSSQPHPHYNLYSDTTAFFLTYGGTAGKRASASAHSTSNPAETFHWDHRLVIYHDQYSGGIDYGEIQQSSFENGEGWMSAPIFQNQSADFIVSGITNSAQAAGLPKLELVITGRGPQSHNVEVSAGARIISNVSVTGYNSVKFESDLQWADISSNQFTLRIKVTGVGAQPARVSLGYVKISYPQSLTFNGTVEKFFTLTENASNVSAIQLQSPPTGAVLYDVTDPNNVVRIPTTQTATLNAVVGQTSSRRKLLASNAFIVPTIRRVSFRQINPSAQNYVIITHPSLRKSVSGYTDPVKAIGEYRSLPQGGGFDTLIVNVDQLYNQFNYGETSPLAIYNFLKFLKTGKLPDHLFLVGKGLSVDYGYYRSPASFPQFRDLVPTGGFPASDMRFSTGLSNHPGVPAIATGRLSATGPADVAAYFNKLKEFEGRPFDDLRRKNILHLSGGLYDTEPQQFRSYLEEFGTVAKSFYLGGNVKAIAKQSTDIEVINVADEVNKGLNLITLFGHSSPTSSDFDIGLVTDPLMGYNNKGKYPALLLNGCLAGSYFLNTSIFGENWTNTPDRGAIGVIAHSYFGFAPYLKLYSNYFYKVGFGDTLFISKGIGEVQKEVAKRLLSDNGLNFVTETQVQQMVLLGDPAVSLFGARKPDYAIIPNSVSMRSTDGSKLSAFSDSLELRFVVHNYGQAKNKSIIINVARTLNNNSVVEYDTTVKATLYADTISVLLPGRVDQGFGNNNFSITIDNENDVDELSEENNSYSQVFFIPLSGTKNLYPDPYAIVNSLGPTLSLQHTDQLSDEREFLLEVDTVKEFNSGFLQAHLVTGKVLVSKQIDLALNDSTVYYWRTKLAQPLANENTNWEVSSFTYINNGPTGWTQVRFGQFEENFTERLEKDSDSKKIEFTQTVTNVDVIAYSATQPQKSSIKVNGAEVNLYTEGNFQCRDNTINLIAFDKTTTHPYAGLYFTWIELRDLFGSAAILCGREPYVINSFKANEVAMGLDGDLIKYISNIPAGDSVVLFTIGDAGISSWPATAKLKMEELGVSVSQLDQLVPGEPVVIFARKGSAPGMAKLHRGQDNQASNQIASVQRTVTGRESEGTMTTELIGPAHQWHDFKVKYETDNSSDVVSFTIHGVDLSGKSTVVIQNVLDDVLLTNIDAKDYPYLRITYSTKDETFVTAAELNRWMVTYEPVAEGLLLYNGQEEQISVSEGQTWTGSYSFTNISDRNFIAPLTVDFRTTKSEATNFTVASRTIDGPAAGQTTTFDVEFPTRNQVGVNDLFVFVNPRVEPENDYDNNFITLVRHLNVLADTLSPLLEVTFDGRFISHEENVSTQPDIKVVVIDNNPFLLSNDTTGVRLFLQYPCEDGGGCVFKPVYFSDANISWSPETIEREFEVHLRQAFDIDGVYTLRVIASDASGNLSGQEPYEMSFSISHTNFVTISSPYPNPFNDQTNFEIVVSGEAVPSEVEMSVINTKGEVVRTFSSDAFGDLHFGRNIFAWQGLDENGTPVPNGIYIFKLRIKSDQGFTEKIGKVVLVR